MKKKILKIIALLIAIVLIVLLGCVANSLNGNPISRMLAKRAANAYLEEHFPDTDYYIDRLGYSFKFGGYYAHVRSDSSMDTQFALSIDMVGNVFYDTYEDVTDGYVTARRLDQEYRELTDPVFKSPAFPYQTDIQYGTLEIHPKEAFEDPLIADIPGYGLLQEDLHLDQIYDIRELGRQAGHLVVYVDSDTISYEYAAQILLDVRKQFDRAGIPFRVIDFVLQYPRPEDGPRPDHDIRVEGFLYEDIYGDGLAERIAQAHGRLQAYYDALDSK